ncbi:hypothetical protein FGIG_10977 [Fasciola gigantica]|uniref:Uncharacterized protein n=1 Tax=Fasciola gigantica TaxID=46835 RepID=A0A504Z2T4_FASGI|nr:hypothetical protein FGIG_10977 [Fasciola gigantica]
MRSFLEGLMRGLSSRNLEAEALSTLAFRLEGCMITPKRTNYTSNLNSLVTMERVFKNRKAKESEEEGLNHKPRKSGGRERRKVRIQIGDRLDKYTDCIARYAGRSDLRATRAALKNLSSGRRGGHMAESADQTTKPSG